VRVRLGLVIVWVRVWTGYSGLECGLVIVWVRVWTGYNVDWL